MNQLFVRKIEIQNPVSLSEADCLLEKYVAGTLVKENYWKSYSYIPKVSFRIGHINNEIWLKFYVIEKCICARETQINGQVFKDSCVEFFISFDKKNYYNLEFNCIGAPHVAYGDGRENRKFVPPEIIKKIEIESTLGNKPFEEQIGEFEWEMMIRIPLECFAFDKFNSFSGRKAKANFQKCASGTSMRHYATWKPIKTEKPDFHRPEFFGDIFFE